MKSANLAVVVLLAAILPAGCRTVATVVEPAPVLLVTFDTLRADRLDPARMPELTELAGGGWSFSRVHAPVPLTLPSHATILTGLGPHRHGVRDNIGYSLDEAVPTLAGAFAAAGYETAAFVGGYPLDRAFGLARGFDTYDDRMTRASGSGPPGNTERRADEVVAATREWLEDPARGDRYFVWVHFYDAHDPYEAPPGPWAGHEDPYDGEVAFADHALGELLDAVSGLETARPWILVTADHGEALGEHGEPTHGVFLYESTLRVPLVVAPPAAIDAVGVDAAVSLADLAPTLLELNELPVLDPSDGISLVPLLAGASRSTGSPTYLESVHGRRKYGWAPLFGLVDWPHKFVAAPRPELYDLEQDPGELSNLASGQLLDDWTARLELIRGQPGGGSAADDAGVDLERLASLGYVGGATSHATIAVLEDRPRADPKDRVAALPFLTDGLRALSDGDLAAAREALELGLRIDPDNLVALNNLGIVLLRRGDVAGAERQFAAGLEKDPSADNLANNLGLARSRLGRHAEAVEAFRLALAGRPGFTAARFNLSLALHRLGRHDEALVLLAQVRDEDPQFPDLERTEIEVRRVARNGS